MRKIGGFMSTLTSPIEVKPEDAASMIRTHVRTGIRAPGRALSAEQEGLLREADEVHVQRKSVQVARDEMRQMMLDLLPTLASPDLRKMVELNPSLRRRIVDRAVQDPKGANVQSSGEKEAGKRLFRVNVEWTRERVIEEMTELYTEDPQEFVRVMERTAGTKKQKVPAVDAIFQKSLVTFLENAPSEGEATTDVPFAQVTTSLFSEPRATLLEWGTLSIRYALREDSKSDSVPLMRVEDIAALLSEKSAKVAAGMAVGLTPISAAMQTWMASHEHFDTDDLVDLAMWVVLLGRSWAASGFPMLRPTHTLAAALMASGMPRELVPEIAMPWPTFAVLIPDGMLPSPVGTLTQPLKFVGLTHGRGATGYTAWVAESTNACLWTWDVPELADLMAPVRIEGEANEVFALRELLGRLLIGTLVEMDSPERRAAIEAGPPSLGGRGGKTKATTDGAAPTTWAFELRRDIKVDLRPWVREYVSGGGKTASVRVLVRGHHRHQACGAGHKNRKWIWIHPHWSKKDSSLPIALRAHRVGSEDE